MIVGHSCNANKRKLLTLKIRTQANVAKPKNKLTNTKNISSLWVISKLSSPIYKMFNKFFYSLPSFPVFQFHLNFHHPFSHYISSFPFFSSVSHQSHIFHNCETTYKKIIIKRYGFPEFDELRGFDSMCFSFSNP